MANILIVEDDVHKRDQLVSFLSKIEGEPSIEQAGSLIGGIRSLRATKPDCVILDMTLPNYEPESDGHIGSVLAFGGVEFLRQVRRYRLDTKVIVVTQFETFGDDDNAKDRKELDAELREQFSNVYKGMVYYHASLSDWSDELQRLLDQSLMEIGE